MRVGAPLCMYPTILGSARMSWTSAQSSRFFRTKARTWMPRTSTRVPIRLTARYNQPKKGTTRTQISTFTQVGMSSFIRGRSGATTPRNPVRR